MRGWRMPCSRMESASSASAASSMAVRGCRGLGVMRSRSISKRPPCVVVPEGIRAPRPLPSPPRSFGKVENLVIWSLQPGGYLLRQGGVGHRTSGGWVVLENGLAEAGGLGETDVARYHRCLLYT